MNVYPGSSLFGFNRPLESIPPGRLAQEYSYTNTPQTGGDGILTGDPAGQVLHFSDNRDVGVYRRVKDFFLGIRHWKGKRLTLRRGSGLLTWEINGLLVHSEVDNGVVPTQWAFTGPGGYMLSSVRVSGG